jgi:hypothetical protein
MIMFLQPGKPILCVNSLNWPLQKSALLFTGNGLASTSADSEKTNRTLVRVDPSYFRPTEVETLLAILPRRIASWAGSTKSVSKSLCVKWSRAI